jgi:predicted HicB family RNase H-like nuclease
VRRKQELKRISIRLQRRLHEVVTKYCEREKVSFNEFAIASLARYLEDLRSRGLMPSGAPSIREINPTVES